jgi:hypothetical protein
VWLVDSDGIMFLVGFFVAFLGFFFYERRQRDAFLAVLLL